MIRKFTITYIIFILLMALALPSGENLNVSANTGGIEVAEASINVRSGPGLAYPVVASMKGGDAVEELSRSGDWIEVTVSGETGWIASWLTKSSVQAKAAASKTAVSSVNRLNVRTQPDLSASVLTQMNAGEQATILTETHGWAEVEFRGSRGFVSTDYISINESSNANPAPAASDVSSIEIAVDTLNVRKKADLSSAKQGTVKKGEIYPVLKLEGNWVQIQLDDNKTGWVYSFYGHLSNETVEKKTDSSTGTVTVQTNGTNMRTQATTSSEVAARANAGDQLAVVAKQGDWYQVALSGGGTGFIASWVVAAGALELATEEEKPARKKGTLNGLTIVLDPGHGGNDGGTVGVRKTEEKGLTLKTAELLSKHLRSAGAEVYMTRQSDAYVDLRQRVAEAHKVSADAFISIHYDATEDNSVSGFTSYYMHDYQQELATYLNSGLGSKLTLRDRGVQPGNYLVLRENRQAAVLVELGFLSNYTEERIISSEQFREQAALGLYQGTINYFDAQLGK
ncbi:N-acetylmuramoyl-L-alanine amidase [Planococcus salinarum]|uniref:N-acetylmuramoyl-L-alanine amidase n=1 Tax=Planococcus salinarum TaxID=622695 RepID=A0ABX3D1B7_9BACL|nr:SH3 domain-containing protein [Planococcus salinarum]OHX54284.1 N-acetylmuramoyl-L-alanine amidase [Planococcus salinarum]TAA66555.1 N-acetylmuramoyl-L-alanine amidase [Planococcus salinarum]